MQKIRTGSLVAEPTCKFILQFCVLKFFTVVFKFIQRIIFLKQKIRYTNNELLVRMIQRQGPATGSVRLNTEYRQQVYRALKYEQELCLSGKCSHI